MSSRTSIEAVRNGEITIRELRGITDEEMTAGVRVGRRLTENGDHHGAAEVLAGLALYDPFNPDVWRALEDLFRRARCPEPANFFADLARIMAAPVV